MGAAQRTRPMLMTGLALSISLIPILVSDGTGADVMKRIAAPMVGGTASAMVAVLLVFPALFVLWKSPAVNSARFILLEPSTTSRANPCKLQLQPNHRLIASV